MERRCDKCEWWEEFVDETAGECHVAPAPHVALCEYASGHEYHEMRTWAETLCDGWCAMFKAKTGEAKPGPWVRAEDIDWKANPETGVDDFPTYVSGDLTSRLFDDADEGQPSPCLNVNPHNLTLAKCLAQELLRDYDATVEIRVDPEAESASIVEVVERFMAQASSLTDQPTANVGVSRG